MVIKTKNDDLSPEKLCDAYRMMLLIRRFEEKSGQLYGMGLIAGFCHLYIGQEAVVVGMQSLLNEGDGAITSYRDHGHIIAAGSDPKYVLAELMGRADGCSKGKGGSMHIFDLDKQFYGGHGIVGAQVSLGTGIAFAYKYQNKNNICLTYYGDGASHQGQVYESFNMASLWKLPALYIIENNNYAMGTAANRATVTTNFYKKGEAFGIPGMQVNGMDIVEVIKAGRKAVEHVRSGKGPFLLEMKTYRYRGHSMSDPAKYRSKEEVAEYRENNDPLDNLKKYLIKHHKISEDIFEKFEQEVKAQINDVVEFAKNSPEPDESELYTDVYTTGQY